MLGLGVSSVADAVAVASTNQVTAAMDRLVGEPEARRFVADLVFDPPQKSFDAAFESTAAHTVVELS
jgi:hypothetical protein